jgi:hypothetical protein
MYKALENITVNGVKLRTLFEKAARGVGMTKEEAESFTHLFNGFY